MDLSYYETLTASNLETVLRDADQKYREGKPIFSDEVYDYLLDLLKEKDSSNPFLKEIGGPVIEERLKATLPYPMFSLDKIKNEEKPFLNWRAKYPGDLVLSEKLDGNSGMFYIKNKEMFNI